MNLVLKTLQYIRAYEWERINFTNFEKRKNTADRMGITLIELKEIRKRTLQNARNKVAERTATYPGSS